MTPLFHFKTIHARFSRAADLYGDLAAVQTRVARELMELMTGFQAPDRILDAGCGNGILTRLLAQRFPSARITAFDASERMIHAAQAQSSPYPALAVEFRVADFNRLSLDEQFPVIVSSSALHWAYPLDAALERLFLHLEPGGRFALALMLRGTLRELHEARLEAAPSKPPLAQLPDEAEVGRALASAGFVFTRAAVITYQDRHESADHFLRHIHRQGLTGGRVSRARAPLTRSELNRLMEIYDRYHKGADGKVLSSYRVGFYLAERPCESDRSTTIPDMLREDK
jgi:malonyl-CoA O-methyltransferase